MPTATIYADKDAHINGQDTTKAAQAASVYQNVDDPNGAVNVFGGIIPPVDAAAHAAQPGVDGLFGFPGSVPAGSVVSAASLNIRVKVGETTGTLRVSSIPDFSETAAKYNDYNHNHAVIQMASFPGAGGYGSFNVFGYIAPATRAAFLVFGGDTANNPSSKFNTNAYDLYPSESASPPYLTVTYSSAPGAPGSISTPVANAVYDQSITLFAGQATDVDTPQANLQYEWSYQYNSGAWVVIPGLTVAGTTQKVWNTSALLAGVNMYKTRLRSWDGSQWGPYTTMSGTFTISHTSRVKRWNGTAWVDHNLSRWNGAAWVATKLKRWTGSAWVDE